MYLKKIIVQIIKIMERLSAVLLGLMCVIVFTNIVCRYVFNFSFAWCDEISTFLMIWICFLGSALAYAKNEHMGLDILVKKLPPRGERIMKIVVDLMALFCILLMGQGGYSLMIKMKNWTAPASGLSYSFLYAVVPLSMLVFLILNIFKLYCHVMSLIKGSELSEEGKI